MKKIFIIAGLLLISNLIFAKRTMAISSTPAPTSKISPSPTQEPTINEDTNQRIKELIEKSASIVAQKKLVEKRGIIGTVTDISDTRITISDQYGNTRLSDVDELTKFTSPASKGSFGISDISKGSTLGILGLYNKETQRIMARFVDVLTMPKIIHGAVVSIDSKNYTLNVVSDSNEEFVVDVETITKILGYTKDDGLARLGFSKIKEETSIIVIGFPNLKDKKRITASRILLFPELPKNPKITVSIPSTDETIIPSTGSGKKLTPITR